MRFSIKLENAMGFITGGPALPDAVLADATPMHGRSGAPAVTDTSPKAAGGKRIEPNHILAIACVGIVLANLDLFIVNVALPRIADSFPGSDLDGLSWILNGYAIVYAALLVFFGRLAERYRRDRSFLVGVVLFTVASAACAAAQSVDMLVAFRVLQGAGAALMTPTSLGLLLATFAQEKRGSAVRAWTAVGGFAAAVGPLAGGLLVSANWRWIFLVNVPIGLAALAVGLFKLPAVPGHDVRPPHARDAVLVTFGIGALTFAIMQGPVWGWTSHGVVLSFAAAVLLLAVFIADCLRSDNPFVDPALFRIRPFAGATLIMAPYSVAFGAMLLSLALWMQQGWGWSALKTGIAISPGPFMVPVTSFLVAGRLIARFGAAAVLALGILLFALGFVWFATVPGLTPSMADALVGMLLTGTGVGLTYPTLMGVGTGALPPSSFATGSGVLNMTRQTCLAVGVALLVAILGAPQSPLARLDAFDRAWWAMAGITLLSVVPLMLLRGGNRR
jgi:EmrB/QacA subfamily drug resistance transporter